MENFEKWLEISSDILIGIWEKQKPKDISEMMFAVSMSIVFRISPKLDMPS